MDFLYSAFNGTVLYQINNNAGGKNNGGSKRKTQVQFCVIGCTGGRYCCWSFLSIFLEILSERSGKTTETIFYVS